jgi:hypothetical protein
LVKRNYRQAKRQKEEARKTRQQQKQQRRLTKAPAADADGTQSVTEGGGSPETVLVSDE